MTRFLRGLGAALSLALFAAVSLVGPALAANGFAGSVKSSVVGAYNGSNGLGTPQINYSELGSIDFSQGVSTGQVDLVYSTQLTIAASGTTNLDLAGSLTDPLGATLTFAKVKCLYVFASAANTNDIIIGGASSNAFTGPFSGTTPAVAVRPGGLFVSCQPGTGWTVTAATGDILKTANSGAGTSVTANIWIAGTSS